MSDLPKAYEMFNLSLPKMQKEIIALIKERADEGHIKATYYIDKCRTKTYLIDWLHGKGYEIYRFDEGFDIKWG